MKPLRIVLILFLTAIMWLLLTQFFFCSRYNFISSAPFTGSFIYNPYDSLDAGKWIKGNFHAHSNAWKGITYGHGTNENVHQAYEDQKYAVHCVSNYQKLDVPSVKNKSFISAYEHGYNLTKTHQLVLGGNQVCWLDYFFPQTLHNKQDILNRLATDRNAVIVLSHPAVRKGYMPEDILYLSNYHCMEVLSPMGISSMQWDAALSVGKPVFLLGNDDMHNVFKKHHLGRMCTLVNVPVVDKEHVLRALKTGKSYGVIFGDSQNRHALPALQRLALQTDTINLEMSRPAKLITFTGQQGRLLASFSHTAKAKYKIKKEDHYARATVEYENGTRLFFNPVFYTSSHSLYHTPVPVRLNLAQTLFFRLVGFFVAAAYLKWAWMFIRAKKFSRKRPVLSRRLVLESSLLFDSVKE